jgi:hypothetical protein
MYAEYSKKTKYTLNTDHQECHCSQSFKSNSIKLIYIVRKRRQTMNINKKTTISEGDKPMNTNRQTSIKESKMKVTTPNLIRAAGLSAVVAGTIFAAIQPIHPPDVIASVTTSAFIIITSFKTVMSIFGLFAIAGLYARQVKETGWLGLAGYLLITIFYAVQMCFSFAEPLILPLLVPVAPTFVESVMGMSSGAGGPMNLGAFAVIFHILPILYLLGLLLFGIAIFRSRILPRGAAVLLASSGPLAIIMSQLPHQIARFAAVPMGIALIWLGFALFFERRAPASEPVSVKVSPLPSQTGAD